MSHDIGEQSQSGREEQPEVDEHLGESLGGARESSGKTEASCMLLQRIYAPVQARSTDRPSGFPLFLETNHLRAMFTSGQVTHHYGTNKDLAPTCDREPF